MTSTLLWRFPWLESPHFCERAMSIKLESEGGRCLKRKVVIAEAELLANQRFKKKSEELSHDEAEGRGRMDADSSENATSKQPLSAALQSSNSHSESAEDLRRRTAMPVSLVFGGRKLETGTDAGGTSSSFEHYKNLLVDVLPEEALKPRRSSPLLSPELRLLSVKYGLCSEDRGTDTLSAQSNGRGDDPSSEIAVQIHESRECGVEARVRPDDRRSCEDPIQIGSMGYDAVKNVSAINFKSMYLAARCKLDPSCKGATLCYLSSLLVQTSETRLHLEKVRADPSGQTPILLDPYTNTDYKDRHPAFVDSMCCKQLCFIEPVE